MKYKKEMDSFIVNKKIDNKIYERVSRKRLYSLKYAFYGLVFLLSIITIAHAKDIRNFIRNIGKNEVVVENQKFDLEEMHTQYTNIDNIKDNLVKKISSTTELKKYLGIDILDIEGEYSLLYDTNKDGLVTELSFQTERCLEKEKCNILKQNDKLIVVSGNVYTSNYEDNLDIDYYVNWDSEKIDHIGNIKTKIVLIESMMDDSNVIELHFNYHNVSYNITAYNMSKNELLSFLETELE